MTDLLNVSYKNYCTSSKVVYTLIVKYAKTIVKHEKEKLYSGVFCVTSFASLFLLFAFCSILYQGWHSCEKYKGFCGLFFRGINKTRNSHEIRKVYSECFIFCGVFCEKNISEIPAKCEAQILTFSKICTCADKFAQLVTL